MQALLDFLNSEQGLTLVAAIVGAIWTWLKTSERFAAVRADRRWAIAECAEDAVGVTWQTYVQAIKEARADGKLEETEKAQARELAYKAAVAFGKSRGLDLEKLFGPDTILLWIERAVARAKE